MGPKLKTLAAIASAVVEIARASADEAGWDREGTIAAMQKRVTESPEMTTFSALSDEDQAEVLELVLRELAARRAPRA